MFVFMYYLYYMCIYKAMHIFLQGVYNNEYAYIIFFYSTLDTYLYIICILAFWI